MWGGRSFYEFFLDLTERHRGKILGVFLGLVVALLFIIFGFWKTLFIAICIMIGYLVGKSLDDEGSLDAIWRRLFGER